MTDEQIDRFIKQVVDRDETWDTVAIMGGEPTIHPRFKEIVSKIWHELVRVGRVRHLQVWTNGKLPIDIGELPVTMLGMNDESHPDGTVHVIVADHEKKMHYQSLLAPSDSGQARMRCPSLGICGIALNAYGYWPCGPGSAIAKLFGWSQYCKQVLPGDASEWGNIETLCRLCQQSALTKIPLIAAWGQKLRRIISPTYRKAIDTYHERRRIDKW